jgi:hypothetical protein
VRQTTEGTEDNGTAQKLTTETTETTEGTEDNGTTDRLTTERPDD